MGQIPHPTDVGLDSIEDIRRPNFSKKFANIMYQSADTLEIGCIEIRPETSEEDVLLQYANKFPKECKRFLQEIKDDNDALYRLNGMSQGNRMMSIGRVPEVLECALKYVHGEQFGNDKKDWLHFFRRNPKFMIGDHTKKQHGNVIIK